MQLRGRTQCNCRAIIIFNIYVFIGYYKSLADACTVLWLHFLKRRVLMTKKRLLRTVDTKYWLIGKTRKES